MLVFQNVPADLSETCIYPPSNYIIFSFRTIFMNNLLFFLGLAALVLKLPKKIVTAPSGYPGWGFKNGGNNHWSRSLFPLIVGVFPFMVTFSWVKQSEPRSFWGNVKLFHSQKVFFVSPGTLWLPWVIYSTREVQDFTGEFVIICTYISTW